MSVTTVITLPAKCGADDRTHIGARLAPFRPIALAGVWAMALASAAVAASSALADAVERQEPLRIRALLETRAEVNGAQPDGMTALHWAVYREDAETAKQLLRAGANPQSENRYGVTPLALAAANGDAKIVALLLAAGADPNAARRGGETALMSAARNGRVEPVKHLLAAGARPDAREQNGQTALMWAAAEGHADVVELLIAAGADFRTSLESGFTPLFFAVRDGRIEVVRALLQAGVSVSETMQPKKTSARMAKKGTSALHLAVENGHFDLAVALLEAGASPNDLRAGYAPLHMLSWVRKPDRGDDGDPSPIGSGQMTSLEFAKALVQHGANVNARLERGPAGGGRVGRKGATPFLLAADTADVPLLRVLLELGADPLLANEEGCTPLMAAAGVGTRAPGEEAGTESEALEAVGLLLGLGADLNTVDENGETAMHGAAYASFPRVVRLLAAKGAGIDVWNRPNKRGWTPLLIAQGHRFGNFKPSAETVAAITEVMLANGVTPPAEPSRVASGKYEGN